MNRRLHDYLDFKWIKIVCKNNTSFEGNPIVVNYPDDTGYSEDMIVLENGHIQSFLVSDIESIEIIEE